MVLRKLSQSFKVSLALMLSVFSSGLLQVAPAYAGGPNDIDICHATSSESNPYISQSPAKSGDVAGHDGHHGEGEDVVWYPGAKDDGVDWDDIIPEFTYTDENDVEQTYPGKNWTAEGMAIYNNGCQTLATSLNITPSTCVDQEVDDGTLSITISGSFDNGSKIVLKQGATQINISNPINDDDDLPVVFNNLAAGTYTVSLEKGNTIYAAEAVTLSDCGNETTPENPTVLAAAQPCVEGDETQDVLVTVTNTNDDTNEAETYDVTINGTTMTTASIADGSNGSVTFPGLPADTYDVDVLGSDGTTVSTTVTVADCGNETTPENPTVLAAAQPCVEGDETQDVLVTVTNTNDDTNEAETYDVTINGTTMTTASIADGSNGSVTFPGLPADTYDVDVLGSDGTTVSTTVTVADCGGRGAGICVLPNNVYFAPWMYDGDTYPEADDYMSGGQNVTNNGTFTFKSTGLYLSTPMTPDYVFGLIDAGSTRMSDVDKMSYKTLRELSSTGAAHIVPSYVLYVDLNGAAAGGEDYLIYEPIYTEGAAAIQTGVWQTWDTYKSGDAKYWSAYGTSPGYIEWSDWVSNNPDGVVLAYGFNQGTGNEGINSAIQNLTFDCGTTTFGVPQVLGDDDKKPIITGGQGGGQTLGTAVLPAMIPATGENDSPFMILVAALMAYGAAYFLQGRRQLVRNQA